MIYPVPRIDGKNPVISSRYRSPQRPDHIGVDIMFRRDKSGAQNLPEYSKHYYMPSNVYAVSILPGRVTTARTIGTGGYVVIEHAGGLKSQYMHLRRLQVNVGDKVDAGQPVGFVYHNPRGYRLNHLHFQLRKNERVVDPAPYLLNAKVINEPMSPFVWKLPLVGLASFITYKMLK